MNKQQKILAIFFKTLKDMLKAKPETLGEYFECSTETIRNRLNGTGKLQNTNKFCEILTKCIDAGKIPSDFYDEFLHNLKDEDIYIPPTIYDDKQIDTLMRYLLLPNQKFMENQPIYKLLHKLQHSISLKNVMEQKLQLHAERYGFFKLNSIDEQCASLGFWDLKSNYSYTVCIYFLCTENWHSPQETALSIYNEQKKMQYNSSMILYFSLFEESKKNVFECIKDNIYIEQIEISEVNTCKRGKDFINIPSSDAQDMVRANIYTDIILEHLSKYFTVIHKNIMFKNLSYSLPDVKSNWILWNAKSVDHAELNFETELWSSSIKKTPEAGDYLSFDLLILIGFWSFPLLQELHTYYKHVICLENSCECVNAYKTYITRQHPEFLKEHTIHFVPFTSIISEYVSVEYNLLGKADAVIFGIGSASLFRSISKYAAYVNRWLKPEGVASFSFYNSQFLYDYHSKYELNQYCTYIPILKENRALVTNSSKSNAPDYYIYCKLYEHAAIYDILNKYFSVEYFYSYPSILFKNTSSSAQSELHNIYLSYDKKYSLQGISPKLRSSLKGFYITAFIKKKIGKEITIEKSLYAYQKEIKKASNYISLKVVFLKRTDKSDAKVYGVLLSKHRRLPEDVNGNIILNNMQFALLSYKKINDLGFEIGYIPPFFSYNHAKNTFCFWQFLEIPVNSKNKYALESNTPGYIFELSSQQLQQLLRKYGYTEVSK